MKHVAVLWWLLIYWSGELVAKSRILQTQVIGHLTERLPTLRGGIQGQSSLSQSEYSAPEPPKLEKLNAELSGGLVMEAKPQCKGRPAAIGRVLQRLVSGR